MVQVFIPADDHSMPVMFIVTLKVNSTCFIKVVAPRDYFADVGSPEQQEFWQAEMKAFYVWLKVLSFDF